MTMFDENQVRRLFEQLPAERPAPSWRVVVVVDRRNLDSVKIVQLFPRAWAPDGVVQQSLELSREQVSAAVDWLREPCADGRAIVLLLGGPVDETAEAFFSLDHCRSAELAPARDNPFARPSSRGKAAPPRSLAPFVVAGRERLSLNKPPVFVRARSGPAPERNLLTIFGPGDSDGWPPRTTFELTGVKPRQTVDLKIDIEPDLTGDRWVVSRNDERLPETHDHEIARRAPLRRLILIFDRTCPDGGQWSAAYNASMDLAGAAAEPESATADDWGRHGGGTAKTPSPTELAGETRPARTGPELLNAEIREALVDVLGREFAGERLTITPIWFADQAKDGLCWPPNFDPPIQSAGHLPNVDVAGLALALEQNCTYSPGVDLWDPVDDALKLAVDDVQGAPEEAWGVLIVGNSPPAPPLQHDSPLWELLRLDGHSVRAQTDVQPYTSTFAGADRSRFIDHVEKLQRKGVPIAYLFLTHPRCDPEHRPVFNAYQSLSTQVLRVLKAHVHLEDCEATHDGIRRVLPAVLDHLRNPPASLVQLARGNEEAR